MFNSPAIDLVILLSFTYFVGSLMVSAINEAVAGGMRWRQDHLELSLHSLLFDSKWKDFVSNHLMTSPHIQSLMKAPDKYPAYIPSKSFVQALIGIMGAGNYTADNLQKAISDSTILPPALKTVLVDIAAQGSNDLKKFEDGVSEFYTSAMDRAGGVYKVKIRRFLLFFGLLVAVALNIDTIGIVRTEMADKNKLNQTVDNIVSELPYIKRTSDSAFSISVKVGDKQVSIDQSAKKNNPGQVSGAAKKLADMQIVLQSGSDYRFGYENTTDFAQQWTGGPDPVGKFLVKLLGVILSTFALQLGSNYWFDLMNKVVNLRAAGKKPNGDQKEKIKS